MTNEDQEIRNPPAKRPPKPKPENPIDTALSAWLLDLPPDLSEEQIEHVDAIISGVPKRWVVYPPMVLLPAGNSEYKWWGIAESKDKTLKQERDHFWVLILNAISKREGKGRLTHLAINSGIPLHTSSSQEIISPEAEAQDLGAENILRSPSGLIMLYGDFGPSLPASQIPTEKDFQDAFWVSTKQNGITQVWAPRYTMFSRGNVKEKARLLDFHSSQDKFLSRNLGHEVISSSTAVDLYAGIGYFVFSYVKMGVKRVIGWELNPWSIEGMRRGAIANGWTIKIVGHQERLEIGSQNIIVLEEDNALALARLQGLEPNLLGEVKHINCGLLPTSELSWEMASKIMQSDGWLHLHENVGVEDIETRKAEIEKAAFRWWRGENSRTKTADVEHVELVKTFAPGVWHCVFDVCISYPSQG